MLPSCQEEEEENQALKKVVGSYTGCINYFDNPIPGDSKHPTVDFIIVKESNDEIRIKTSFELKIRAFVAKKNTLPLSHKDTKDHKARYLKKILVDPRALRTI